MDGGQERGRGSRRLGSIGIEVSLSITRPLRCHVVPYEALGGGHEIEASSSADRSYIPVHRVRGTPPISSIITKENGILHVLETLR